MNMSKSKKKPVLIILGATLVLSVLTVFALNSPRQIPEDLAKKEQKGTKVTELTPKYEDGDLKFDRKEGSSPAGSDAKVQVVNDYLDKIPAVPKEAQLIDVKMEGATAVLNFNDAFRSGYGTEDEQIIVEGILTTLSQFAEVQNVLFKINGQPLDSLGNIDLSQPQSVMKEDSRLKDDEKGPAPDSAN